jgi:hypothetical protein
MKPPRARGGGWVGNRKLVWIILLTIPFWTSYLLRIFAWKIHSGLQATGNRRTLAEDQDKLTERKSSSGPGSYRSH